MEITEDLVIYVPVFVRRLKHIDWPIFSRYTKSMAKFLFLIILILVVSPLVPFKNNIFRDVRCVLHDKFA